MLSFETFCPPPERLLKPRKPRHEVSPESKGPAQATRKPAEQTFGTFFSSVISQNGGVVAAFPKTTLADDAIASRVVGLDRKRNVGRSLWWTKRLVDAKYDSSYKRADHYVYSTDGLDRNDQWFPRHSDIDPEVSETGFDYLTLGGFSVTIRALPNKAARDSAVVAHRFSHEMEAAASGVAPAVLAGFLVAEQAVLGQAFVTQRHAFRLSDLLKEYNRFRDSDLLRPGLAGRDASVYELTAGVAKKVRMVANARLLKMNMTPDSVVFCPHLVEDEAGAMTAAGYGFGRCDTKGVPYLVDFDPTHTKRGAIDADAGYKIMMTQLLGMVRAQFGDVYGVMLNKLTGRSPSGSMLPPDELPENFDQIDLRKAVAPDSIKDVLLTMPVYQKTPELVEAYAEAAADVTDATTQLLVQGVRPLFQKLAAHHLRCALPDTALAPMPPAATSAIQDRLAAVRLAREQLRVV